MSQDLQTVIRQLCTAFPDCFNESAPKPLKIGLGEAVNGGFRLNNPGLQVFEKKAKPETGSAQ